MPIEQGDCVLSILTLSVIGFFILFTLVAALPSLSQKKTARVAKSRGRTAQDISRKIIGLSDFNIKLIRSFEDERTVKIFVTFSLIYLFSAVICMANISFPTRIFGEVLGVNLVLVFLNTLGIFVYFSFLTYDANRIDRKEFDEIINEFRWLAGED